jgi:transcriptional repressor NrdR
LRCPFCAHEDSQVKDSRPTEDGSAIRRRRQCEDCGARFTTFERASLRELTITKSNGGREAFERAKLERSLSLACRKRPVPPERIERLVTSIQRQLETGGDSEIPSARIGELVMEGLQALDPVAYIRFASVYKDFTEAKDFERFAGSVRAAGKEPAREKARDLPLPFLEEMEPTPARGKRPH